MLVSLVPGLICNHIVVGLVDLLDDFGRSGHITIYPVHFWDTNINDKIRIDGDTQSTKSQGNDSCHTYQDFLSV